MVDALLCLETWSITLVFGFQTVGIKSFIRLFGITAALIKVSAAQEERVNAAGTKLQLLAKLQLLTELQLLMDTD
ncbi:hypothetical protein Tco_0109374 [Tanacetum coccineum]